MVWKINNFIIVGRPKVFFLRLNCFLKNTNHPINREAWSSRCSNPQPAKLGCSERCGVSNPMFSNVSIVANPIFRGLQINLNTNLLLTTSRVWRHIYGRPFQLRFCVYKWVSKYFVSRDEEITSLSLNLRRLSTLSQIQNRISEICDTSFLFWHRVIIPIHFGYIFDNDKKDANRLPVKLTQLCKGFLFLF